MLFLWQTGRLPFPPSAASQAPWAAEVPELRGVVGSLAGELLDARELRLTVEAQRPHPTLPAGSIIEQKPLPGSTLSPGDTVSVVISTGPSGSIEIPRTLSNITAAEAIRDLRALGLTATTSPADAPGTAPVTRSEPAAGTTVERGSTVTLFVGPAQVEVPRVVGMRFKRAVEALEQAGLTPGRVREDYNENKLGMVILAQDPEAGTKVEPRAKVDLVRNQDD